MTYQEISYTRLTAQQISNTNFTKPGQIVAHLGAMQAQDFQSSLWAIGLRLPGSVLTDIEAAINNHEIIRTWPMRGTLHFVAADDVRWMLKLLTPKVISGSAKRHRDLELDERVFAKAKNLFEKALAGNKILTRNELFEILQSNGIDPKNQRGYHIIIYLCQTGFVCLGPHQGKQPAFVLLDEWVPKTKELDREASIVEITKRYFTSHGPATIADFAWWAGLNIADIKIGLAQAGSSIIREVVEGQEYWMPHVSPKIPTASGVYLLPAFDEYLLGYKDRSAVLHEDHKHKLAPGNNGMFMPTIIIDGQVAGLWKRLIGAKTIKITLDLFRPLSQEEEAQVMDKLRGFSAFADKEITF